MKETRALRSMALALVACLCALSQAATAQDVKAFPTAEGFGANAVGGRGGRVIHVTNLNDSGPGSFRAACEASGPRIVVFDVSGTINGSDQFIYVQSNITIAGQTSPGGIQLKGNGLIAYRAHDVIMRHMRIRPGAHLPTYEDTNGFIAWGTGTPNSGRDDQATHNVIIDHCSFEWSTDQNGPDTWGWVYDFTSQWNITAEGTNDGHSYGPGVNHNKGFIIAGYTQTYHHSLLAHCSGRNPQDGGREVLDWRNNIIYNWAGNDCSVFGEFVGNCTSFVNVVNNHYLSGPNSGLPYFWLMNGGPTRIDGSAAAKGGTKVYVSGVWGPNCPNGTAEDWNNGFYNLDYYESGINPSYQPACSQAQFRSLTPFAAPPVATDPTGDLLTKVLPKVGACKPYRDSVDTRIVNSVLSRTGNCNTVGTGGPWPDLATGAPLTPLDTDQDGMPDTWEAAHGLDKNNAADGAAVSANGYTNVENYLNELAGDPISGGNGGSTLAIASPANGTAFPGNTATVTVTWNFVTGAQGYVLRCTDDTGAFVLYEDAWTAAQVSVPVRAGHAYNYWMHWKQATGSLSAAVAVSFSVSNSANQPPAISSQPWANPNPVTLPNTTTMSVVASDPDSGPNALTYQWSMVNGPGTVNFSPNANTVSATSSATFTVAGTYTLRVAVSDGIGTVTADLAVTVNASTASGPVAHWKLDDGSGTLAADAAGNNNTGTLQGNAAWTSTGMLGGALVLDGASGRVAVASSSSLSINSDITLAAWMKTSSAWPGHLVGGYGASPYPGYGFIVNYPNPGQLSYWSGAYGYWVSSTATGYNDGLWHHVAVCVSGTTATFYKDGVPSGSVTSARPNAYAGVRALGAAYNGTNLLQGALDDLRIYNRALSATEIQTLAKPSGIIPPTITTQPANKSVAAGLTATFSVAATGTAPMSYQWRKNGANLSGATAASYTTPALSFSDSGSLFSVVVSNSAGSVTSNNATLTVLDTTPPTIDVSTVTLKGTADGTGSAIASITVNGQAATLSGSSWSKEVSVNAGTNTFTIVITDQGGNQTTKSVNVTK